MFWYSDFAGSVADLKVLLHEKMTSILKSKHFEMCERQVKKIKKQFRKKRMWSIGPKRLFLTIDVLFIQTENINNIDSKKNISSQQLSAECDRWIQYVVEV